MVRTAQRTLFLGTSDLFRNANGLVGVNWTTKGSEIEVQLGLKEQPEEGAWNTEGTKKADQESAEKGK